MHSDIAVFPSPTSGLPTIQELSGERHLSSLIRSGAAKCLLIQVLATAQGSMECFRQLTVLSNFLNGALLRAVGNSGMWAGNLISRGTQFSAGRGDNLRSEQYSKRQAMRYEKKRRVGSQDKITSS